MGKRSDFKRRARDAYDTPPSAIRPLLRHFPPDERTVFCEPCAGAGVLKDALESTGFLKCCTAWDIAPRRGDIIKANALLMDAPEQAEVFVTNPPWSIDLLHPLIEHLATQLPTFLLMPADWMHNKYSIPYLPWLRAISTIGRVKWIPNSDHVGKDNCCWYLFDRLKKPARSAQFFGRMNDA